MPETSEYAKLTDEELAELCKKDDDVAFQELMRRYMRAVYNFSYQYAKNDADAEDIAQDAFFKTWKHIGRFTKGRQFKPWLFTIARNTALDHLKKRRASAFSDLDDSENDLAFADTLRDEEPLAPILFERAELAGEMEEAMLGLHPEHRAVIILHYHQEMTFEEIADVMGKPMNTVKSWHRRALLRIRSELEVDPSNPLAHRKTG